jgi:hypothetical protein
MTKLVRIMMIEKNVLFWWRIEKWQRWFQLHTLEGILSKSTLQGSWFLTVKRHRYGWVVVCRSSLDGLVKSLVTDPKRLCSHLLKLLQVTAPIPRVMHSLGRFHQNGWGGLGFRWHWAGAVLVTSAGNGCFVVRTIYPNRWIYQDCHRCGCTHAIHLSCAHTSHIGLYLGYIK